MRAARTACRLAMASWVFLALVCVSTAAESNTNSWTSRIIHMQRGASQTRPPVVTAVGLNGDGTQLVTAGDDHLVSVWETSTGQLLHQFEGHTDWVRTVAFSPDGRTLATAGNDRRIIIWDLEQGLQQGVLSHVEGAVTRLAYNQQGSQLAAVGMRDQLLVLDTVTGRRQFEVTCPSTDMRAVAFSTDDRWIAVGGRTGVIRIFDGTTGEDTRDLPVHQGRIRQLLFTPDTIISCGEDQWIRMTSVNGWETTALPRCPAKVLAMVQYEPHRLATAGTDNLIRLWDLSAGTEIGRLEGHTGSIVALDAHGSLLVSGAYDTTARIWQMPYNVADGIQKQQEVDQRIGGGQFNLFK